MFNLDMFHWMLVYWCKTFTMDLLTLWRRSTGRHSAPHLGWAELAVRIWHKTTPRWCQGWNHPLRTGGQATTTCWSLLQAQRNYPNPKKSTSFFLLPLVSCGFLCRNHQHLPYPLGGHDSKRVLPYLAADLMSRLFVEEHLQHVRTALHQGIQNVILVTATSWVMWLAMDLVQTMWTIVYHVLPMSLRWTKTKSVLHSKQDLDT